MIGLAMMMAAQDPVVSMVYTFNGAQSCRDWHEERRGKALPLLEGWVMGYVTAYNNFGPSGGGASEGESTEELFSWVDQYCAKHHDSTVSGAAFELVRDMGKRRATPKP
jgi:hypothetical protein